MQQLKNSRKEALAAEENRYNGSPCKYGHGTVKRTRDYSCIVCVNLAKSRDKKKKRAAMPPKKRGRPPIPEHLKVPKKREVLLEYERKYRKKYPEKIKAKKARYRASFVQRTPKWLTKEDMRAIKQIYAIAVARTKETGILWDVDHIIPLQGETVSGLHVPSNLQVIPHKENVTKGNQFTVG